MRNLNIIVLALVFTLLSACGGGSSGGSQNNSNAAVIAILDTDNDGIPDTKDADDDGDGILDIRDLAPLNKNEWADFDGDGTPDNVDQDDDNDGISDEKDAIRSIKSDFPKSGFAITDFTVDTSRQLMYRTHKFDFSFSVLDLKTGKEIKTIKFDRMPERLLISEDSNKIYIALLEREHSYQTIGGEIGYIVTIDLNKLEQSNRLKVDIDPYDFIVTKSNKIVITSGSSQWTKVAAYDLGTGKMLGSASTYQKSLIKLHPTEDSVYVLYSEFSTPYIDKLDISKDAITTIKSTAFSNVAYVGQNFWITPDGKNLITNGGDLLLASDMGFVSKITLPSVKINAVVFDEPSQTAILRLSNGASELISLKSFTLIEKLRTYENTVKINPIGNNFQHLLISSDLVSTILVENTCAKCNSLNPPKAMLTFSPASGDLSKTFTFDASISKNNGTGPLQYRWDLDNDGIWDTQLTSTPTTEFKFSSPGIKYVRLEVRDSNGITNSITQKVDLSIGISSETIVESSTPFKLDFSITDSTTDFENSKLYVIDKGTKRLNVLNLINGKTERYYNFALSPEKLTISPDGKMLYIAFITQEHSCCRWIEAQKGYIASYSIEQQKFIDAFDVDIDPFDLIATNSGKLIVSSGSGQWTNISAYDATTKQKLGSVTAYHKTLITLDPTSQLVYGGDTAIGPSHVHQFNIQVAGITHISDSPYHGEYRTSGKAWPSPDGKYLICQSGELLNATGMTYVSKVSPRTYIHLENLFFHKTKKYAIFSEAGTGKLVIYDLANVRLLSEIVLRSTQSRIVALVNDTAFVATNVDGKITLEKFTIP